MIKSYAEKLGVRSIVTLQYKNKSATKRIGAPSPEDWINYFNHAEGVITTYFHGTAFAIKFQKSFITIPTPGRVEKVQKLLEVVGLENRFVSNDENAESAIPITTQRIDWGKTKKRLSHEIESSESFLQEALSKKPNPDQHQ